VINQMIKNPDFWMPFACAILKEREQDYIVNPKGILSPYTTISYNSTGKAGDIVTGVHPYDLTVTPQIVEREWNPDYYDLMKRFENLTSRGGILNTSFDLHGHPMVASPEDALDVFERSGLEYLALGNFLISKKPIELRRAGEEVLEHRDRIRSLVGVS
ncbi:MAG: carbamoyltransferase C-terminal domain-containing protein, partial [Candidatus Zixiibacteriota bacterium]